MENASKALILAGEVLIGMVVLSFMVYFFVRMGRTSSNINNQLETDKVLVFNNHFTKFNGRVDITADDIVSVLNFAKNSNNYYEITDDKNSIYYVDVIVDGVNLMDKVKQDGNYISQFLGENNIRYYSCNSAYSLKGNKINVSYKENNDIIKSNQTGLVTMIRFTSTNIKNNGTTYDIMNKDKFVVQ